MSEHKNINIIAGTGIVLSISGTSTTILQTQDMINIPFYVASNTAWTNQPAAITELFGGTQFRSQIDLSNMTSARIITNIATVGSARANLQLQWSSDGTTFFNIGAGTSPSANIGATGINTSDYVLINSSARRDVVLRVIGTSGDGAIDPVLGGTHAQFK